MFSAEAFYWGVVCKRIFTVANANALLFRQNSYGEAIPFCIDNCSRDVFGAGNKEGKAVFEEPSSVDRCLAQVCKPCLKAVVEGQICVF